jgi:hypothetical protein
MNVSDLPPPAQAKLQRLQMASDDASALSEVTRAGISACERRLELCSNLSDSAGDDKRKLEVQNMRAGIENELESLKQVQAHRRENHQAAAGLVSHLSGWIQRLPSGTRLQMLEPPEDPDAEILTTNGADLAETLALIRSRISQAERELTKVKSAPPNGGGGLIHL